MRVLLVLAALLLAGCAAPAVTDDLQAAAPGNVTFTEDHDLGTRTLPREELQNATLGSEHTHDAWGGALELVLLDATLDAGDCEGPQDAAFYALVTAFNAEGPAYGCARVSLPEGTVVPEGTGELRIEVDASDALKNGQMQFQFRNKAREAVLPATSEKAHVWNLPLTEADWDIAHATATTFVMYVGASGPAALFEGTLHARVVAAKLEGWEPILAIAHVDHWRLPSLHTFAAPGVMRVLDADGEVTNIDAARITSGEEHGGIPFEDIVAPGAKWIAIVADTTSSDCAPALTCWIVPVLHVGGYERDRFGSLAFEEDARRVYVWSVPDEVPEDSVYANVSTTQIEPRIDACAMGDAGGASCGFSSIASSSVRGRFQVFVWEKEIDMDLLRALAG